jgi:hypothetical protein
MQRFESLLLMNKHTRSLKYLQGSSVNLSSLIVVQESDLRLDSCVKASQHMTLLINDTGDLLRMGGGHLDINQHAWSVCLTAPLTHELLPIGQGS